MSLKDKLLESRCVVGGKSGKMRWHKNLPPEEFADITELVDSWISGETEVLLRAPSKAALYEWVITHTNAQVGVSAFKDFIRSRTHVLKEQPHESEKQTRNGKK